MKLSPFEAIMAKHHSASLIVSLPRPCASQGTSAYSGSWYSQSNGSSSR